MTSLRTSPNNSGEKAAAEETNPYAAILAESFGAQIAAVQPAPPNLATEARTPGGIGRKASLTRCACCQHGWVLDAQKLTVLKATWCIAIVSNVGYDALGVRRTS